MDNNWFHGKLTREKADQILRDSFKEQQKLGINDSCFLVRESSSSDDEFVLSLLTLNPQSLIIDILHYQIIKHGKDAFFSIDNGPIIHGLDRLIDYYRVGNKGVDNPILLGIGIKDLPPPPETVFQGRSTLLHRATTRAEIRIVSSLITSKGSPNLNSKNQDGQTAVHLATILAHQSVLEILVAAGADVNIRDCHGFTPLHYACQQNKPGLVRFLVDDAEANIQARSSEDGWVPLHTAASRGHKECLRVLLEYGAPLKPRTGLQETPHDLARQNFHFHCTDFLANYRIQTPQSSRKEWLHPCITREQAQSVMKEYNLTDGLFLVRPSSTVADVYVITLVFKTRFYHFKIRKNSGFFYIDDGPLFDSLEHVIEHYRLFSDGLPARLESPIAYDPSRAQRFGPMSDKQRQPLPNINFETAKQSFPLKKVDYPTCIPPNCIELGNRIGGGEFGSVLHGVYTDRDGNLLNVAVKILLEEHMENQTVKNEFLKEAGIMVGLNHNCVVSLIGICLDPSLMMVQELVPMGSMLNYLITFPEDTTVERLRLWASQIAEGMDYLESKKFVHRDLAARNILLASNHQAKISDFGLSRALSMGKDYYRATKGGRWPVKWYAPESVNYGTFSHASDVWSFAVVLWEMFTFGGQPYGQMTGAEVLEFIERGERLKRPPGCPDDVYDLMMDCWKYEPRERPTFVALYLEMSKELTFAEDDDFMCSDGIVV